MGGVQAQYAPSTYVGLWSRVADFRRGQLDRALARRAVVQATLLRATIHVASAADYWLLSDAVRQQRLSSYLRTHATDRRSRRSRRQQPGSRRRWVTVPEQRRDR